MANKFLELHDNDRSVLYYDVARSIWDVCESDDDGWFGAYIRPVELIKVLNPPKQVADCFTKHEEDILYGAMFFRIYDSERDNAQCISFRVMGKGLKQSKPWEKTIPLNDENDKLYGRVLVALMKDTGTDVIKIIRNTYMTVDDLENIVENDLGCIYHYDFSGRLKYVNKK